MPCNPILVSAVDQTCVTGLDDDPSLSAIQSDRVWIWLFSLVEYRLYSFLDSEDCQIEVLSVIASWLLSEIIEGDFFGPAIQVKVECAQTLLDWVISLYIAVLNRNLNHRAA
jgi:hypothetical protein